MRPIWKLWKYIIRAHVAPFFFATAIVMILFLLQFLMKMVDQLVGKGLGVWVIIQLVALNLAWMLVLAVPMGALVSGLMAFGNLSATNEVTAMRASGIGPLKMIFPAIVGGLLVTWATFVFDNDILPDANHQARILATDISQKKPAFAIEPGRFFNEINGYSILAQRTHEYSSELEGVTIFDHSTPGELRIVTAERGKPEFTNDSSKLVFELTNGEIHQIDQRTLGEYRAMKFDRHQIAMSAEGFTLMRTGGTLQPRGDREMNIATMRAEVTKSDTLEEQARTVMLRTASAKLAALLDGPPAPGSGAPNGTTRAVAAFAQIHAMQQSQWGAVDGAQRSQDSYLVEIYKKFSIPFACFVFILVGAPLGIVVKRGTFGVSAGISLAFFVIYWACLITGEKLADRNLLSPFVGMWLANMIIGALGIILVLKLLLPNVFRLPGFRRRATV